MSLEGGHPAVRKDSPRPQPHSMMKKHEGLAQPEPSGRPDDATSSEPVQPAHP